MKLFLVTDSDGNIIAVNPKAIQMVVPHGGEVTSKIWFTSGGDTEFIIVMGSVFTITALANKKIEKL